MKRYPNKLLFHLIIIVALYLLLRVPLMDKALWQDEIRNTFEYLNTSPLTGIDQDKETIPGYSWGRTWGEQIVIHPPALSAFYYVWIRVFGDSEISLHVPTLIAGLGSLLLLYFFGSFVFSRDIGFLAAVAMALSPSHIGYSAEAVHAVFELLVFLASVFVFCRYVVMKDRRLWYLLLALNMLGIFVFYHYLFYIIIQTIALWVLRDRVKVSTAYFITVVLLAALFLFFVTTSYAKGMYHWTHWPKNSIVNTIKIIIFLP